MNVAIYMEGGGQGKNSKAEIRNGMEAFLSEIRDECQKKNWKWKLVCCGLRDEAYKLSAERKK